MEQYLSYLTHDYNGCAKAMGGQVQGHISVASSLLLLGTKNVTI